MAFVMRIGFWASVGLLCGSHSAAAQPSIPLPSGTVIEYSVQEAKTQLVFRVPGGGNRAVQLERDSTVSSQSEPSRVAVIAESGSTLVILVDTYGSIAGGMSYCQAGEESFLRLISLAVPAKQTFSVKLESCIDNVELASPGLEWRAQEAILRVHWLAGPFTRGRPATMTLSFGQD